MENDLKLICDAIPASSIGDVSTQANSILKALTGDDIEFNIGGGNQPKLFEMAAVGIGGRNKVLINRGNKNGDFTSLCHMHYYVDGNSPVDLGNSISTYTYDIQPSDDGKTIHGYLTRDDFQNSDELTFVMNYISPSAQFLNVSLELSTSLKNRHPLGTDAILAFYMQLNTYAAPGTVYLNDVAVPVGSAVVYLLAYYDYYDGTLHVPDPFSWSIDVNQPNTSYSALYSQTGFINRITNAICTSATTNAQIRASVFNAPIVISNAGMSNLYCTHDGFTTYFSGDDDTSAVVSATSASNASSTSFQIQYADTLSQNVVVNWTGDLKLNVR